MSQDIFDRIAAESSSDDDVFDRIAAESGDPPAGLWSRAVKYTKDLSPKQVARGIAEAGTSTVGAIGTLTRSETLQDWARQADEDMAAFYGDEGTGRGVGRLVGELGSAVVGGAGAAKLAAKGAARGVKGADALQKALTSGSRVKRAGATALVNAPVDVVQGAKAEEGLLLPGRLGSIAENIAFSGAAGALFGGPKLSKQYAPGATDVLPAQQGPLPAQQGPLPAWQGPAQAKQGPLTAEQVAARAARSAREYAEQQGVIPPQQGQARAVLGDVVEPQQSQIRGLLGATSTETAPVMRTLPGGSNLPPITYQAGQEVTRTPLFPQAAKANLSQDIPIPTGEGAAAEARKAATEARRARAREAQQIRRQDKAALGRQAKLAETAPDPARFDALDDDALRETVKGFRGAKNALPKNIERLSDDHLAAEVVLARRDIQEQARLFELGQRLERIMEDNSTGKAIGLSGAKKLFGGDISELGALKGFSEEQIGALRDAGFEINPAFGREYTAAWRAYKGGSDKAGALYDRLSAEASRRGLATGVEDVFDETINPLRWAVGKQLDGKAVSDITLNPDGTATVALRTKQGRGGKTETRTLGFNDDGFLIDPATGRPVDFRLPNGARGGFVNIQALTTLAGAGTGALAGAAGADEGDRLVGGIMGGLGGAALGAGAGRLLRGGPGGASSPAPAAPLAGTPPAPGATKTAEQASRARDRINFPASPAAKDTEYRPRTTDEWKTFYERFLSDPAQVAEADALRQSGQAQMRQGTRPIADDVRVAEAIAESDQGLSLKDARRKLSGQELIALRAQRAANAERRLALRAQLNDPGTTAADKVWMQDLLDKLEDQSIAMFERYTRDVSQTGRDLRLLQESVKLSTDPADWLLRAERLAGGKPISPEVWAELMGHLEKKNWAKVQSTISKLKQSTLLDQAGELWQTGLLTGFMRPVRDVISNNLNLADKQVERAAATFFDTILGLRTGVRTADYRLGASAKAMTDGWRRGGQAVKAIFREEGDPQLMAEVMKRYDFERQTLQTNPVLRAYTTFVRKTIGAADAMTRLAATDVALAEQARVFARQTAKPGTKEFDTLVAQYLKNPPPEMLGLAMSQADEVTWQNSTSLGQAASSLAMRNSQSSIARFFGKLAVPFSQTPSAMVTQTVKGSPFALLGTPGDVAQIARKMDVPAAQRRLVNTLGKVSVGSAWIGLGYMLADNDNMTAFYPGDDRERRRWELEGRTEVALKIGGTWVSLLGTLGPQAQLMALGAALRQMTAEDPDWTVATATKTLGTGIARAAGDSPMLQGVNSIADLSAKAAQGDTDALGESMNTAAQTFITGWVPQAVQQVARATDLTDDGKVRVRQVREPGDPGKTAANAVLQGLPGARQTVPVRRDALGQERATSVGGLLGVVSPARLSRETSDPAAQELWRTGAAIPRTPRRPGEPIETYEARQQAVGSAAQRAIESVMASRGYRGVENMNTAQLRTQLSALASRGEVQAEQVERLGSLPDDVLRDRLRGTMLERAVTRARERAGRRYPDPQRGRAGRLLDRLTR